MKRSAVAASASLVCCWSAAAQPDILTFDDLGLPHGTVITDQYASRGVVFSPLFGALELQEASEPLFPAEPIGLAEIPYFTSVIIADFPAGATAAGAWIDFGVIADGVMIEGFDAPGATGTLLASASTTTEEFLGVEASGIRSVRLSNVGLGRPSYLIDNFTFTLIPSPGATAALMLGGTALAARRRRL